MPPLATQAYVSGPVVKVVVSGGPGIQGKSAYQSYVDTTTDDPVKTEAQWVASLSGGISVTNGIASFADQNGDIHYFPVSPTNPFP